MDEPLIFDGGSAYGKIGLASELEPKMFISAVGHRRQKVMVGMGQKEAYVGDEAFSKCGILLIEYPIQHGLIENWHYMERIWHHAFYDEARRAPEAQPLMLLEHPFTPAAAREKTAQVMFETYEVPALFFTNPAVSSLRAVRATTGVVLCSGAQSTYSMAVKDGKGIMSSLVTLDIGGEDITSSMIKFLQQKFNQDYSNAIDTFSAIALREQISYVVLDYDESMKKSQHEVEVEHEFFGESKRFHHELFQFNEMMFKPELYGIETDGIHHMIRRSVNNCDASIRRELLNNIVLSGGNTMMRGLNARLVHELKSLAPEHAQHVRIESGADGFSPKFLPHIGASLLASSLQDWISKAEYDEVGPSIVHNKCPIGIL